MSSVLARAAEHDASPAAEQVAAGPFGRWLNEARAALQGDAGSDVPCGDCVGCCVSSYFIPVRPQDSGAIARIPLELLVRMPGAGGGNAVMGYREDGTCPMLHAGKCSIYADRPQTCRDYDCRIFAAAGIDAGGDDKHVINRRVRAWRFAYPSEADRTAHEAVRNAAAFIRDKKACFPGGRAPTAPTGIAVLAIKAYRVFLDQDLGARSDEAIAAAIVAASRQFDAMGRMPECCERKDAQEQPLGRMPECCERKDAQEQPLGRRP